MKPLNKLKKRHRKKQIKKLGIGLKKVADKAAKLSEAFTNIGERMYPLFYGAKIITAEPWGYRPNMTETS